VKFRVSFEIRSITNVFTTARVHSQLNQTPIIYLSYNLISDLSFRTYWSPTNVPSHLRFPIKFLLAFLISWCILHTPSSPLSLHQLYCHFTKSRNYYALSYVIFSVLQFLRSQFPKYWLLKQYHSWGLPVGLEISFCIPTLVRVQYPMRWFFKFT
jgi:hypothetical protein